MVICLKCGAEPMEEVKRHVHSPDQDVFRCPSCGHRQKRYDAATHIRMSPPVTVPIDGSHQLPEETADQKRRRLEARMREAIRCMAMSELSALVDFEPWCAATAAARLAALPSLLAVAREIASDNKCDLVSSERRIRLYYALHGAGESSGLTPPI